MKIGLVTGEFPPLEGGVGAFTQELARALAAAGHECHVITSRAARPPDPQRKFGALHAPIEWEYATIHPQIRSWRWPALAATADLVLQHEFDLVNIQYQAAAYHMRSAAVNMLPWRLRGMTRTAVTFHDLRVPYLFPKAGPLRRQVVTLMARQAHGCIVTNAADAAELRLRTSRPVVEIPIGSNIAVMPAAAAQVADCRAQAGLQAGDTLLAYFGFLNQSKGADTLLRALALLDPSVHLIFVGGRTGSSDTANNAAFLAALDALVTELGLDERVHWTGFQPQEQVSAYLQAADLVVMPYRDGASLRRGTLMAALAHGRPLVTTTPQQMESALRHGQNCWLVPVDNAPALAAAVQRLTADASLAARLGAQAAQTARLFSWDKIAAQTAAFFETLL